MLEFLIKSNYYTHVIKKKSKIDKSLVTCFEKYKEFLIFKH